MGDLWADRRSAAVGSVAPLAVRMRPRSLDEFAGQAHIVGKRGSPKPLLRRMIDAGTLTSLLFHGPPGTGKTTLARLVASESGRPFVQENAGQVGVKRIREIANASRHAIESTGKISAATVLFLDEIHRFSRAQQDVLLSDVEAGVLTLIGATTENPMFTVNAALVSRSTVFRLEPLTVDDVQDVLNKAVSDSERGFGSVNEGRGVVVDSDAIEHISAVSDGDARRALNALEVAVLSLATEQENASSRDPLHVTLEVAQDSVQRRAVVYDRQGDQHYDHASALIKSVRGSDPDAAVYYLALMLEAGEDPRFIARRLAILASEDIGNADPRAMVFAESCWSLVERIGMPEARISLANLVTYLALAPKSNASYAALMRAESMLFEGRKLEVPLYLRDPNKAKSVGSARHGKGYMYAHESVVNTSIGPVTGQPHLVDQYGNPVEIYEPTRIGAENVLRDRLEEVRRTRAQAMSDEKDSTS